MAEKRDAMIAGLVTRRQKTAVDNYCWQNRISQSELVRNLVENLLELKT